MAVMSLFVSPITRIGVMDVSKSLSIIIVMVYGQCPGTQVVHTDLSCASPTAYFDD